MNVLIAGASGFIGQKLVSKMQLSHNVTVLGRNKSYLTGYFSQPINRATWEDLSGLNAHKYDAIINLCGYNISSARWSERVKQNIIQSRVQTSRQLIDWVIKQGAKPHFICANAVGIYGMQDNEDKTALDEDTIIDVNKPRDFMSQIGIQWEHALQTAIDYGLSVTTTRFGIVLAKNGGILKKLSPSFYLGLGSVIGEGTQVMSWVHMDDVVGGLLFLIHRPDLNGAFNLTSPHPVSQAEFAEALAKAMHRRLLFKIPAWIIRLIFGEMGECLLLKGQRVVPTRLIKLGYKFRYANLADALHHEYN